MKQAVILVGHGSRARGFQNAMTRVARALQADRRWTRVTCAYLEINSPSIPEAIRRSVRAGAREIRILPYFLLTGLHVKTDIPEIALAAQKEHRGKAKIILCPYLGYHKKIVEVIRERLGEIRK